MFIGSLSWGTDECEHHVAHAAAHEASLLRRRLFCAVLAASGRAASPISACVLLHALCALRSSPARSPCQAAHWPAPALTRSRRSRNLHQAFSNVGEVVEARVRVPMPRPRDAARAWPARGAVAKGLGRFAGTCSRRCASPRRAFSLRGRERATRGNGHPRRASARTGDATPRRAVVSAPAAGSKAALTVARRW